MARGAALHFFGKQILMARFALGMHGLTQAGHVFIALGLVAIRAILRLWLNGLVSVVALAAVYVIVFTVRVMAPFGRFKFHMVAGYAGGQVVDAFGVVCFELFVKGNTVTGPTAFNVLAGGGVFVVAFLALDFVLRGVDLMVKNDFSARVVQ